MALRRSTIGRGRTVGTRDGRRPLPALLITGALLAACSSAGPATTPEVAVASVAASAAPAASAALPSRAPSPVTTPAPTAVASLEPAPSADPGAPPSKVSVNLAIRTAHFLQTELNAPADKTWQLVIDDQDQEIHNFTLQAGADRLWQTPRFGHGTSEFTIPGLPAGTYLFRCTFHTSMRGSLEIG